MNEENKELTKEELEDIELEKTRFTRAEIEEMDRRSHEQSVSWNDFFKEIDKQVQNL